jgi:hypothetical protein
MISIGLLGLPDQSGKDGSQYFFMKRSCVFPEYCMKCRRSRVTSNNVERFASLMEVKSPTCSRQSLNDRLGRFSAVGSGSLGNRLQVIFDFR